MQNYVALLNEFPVARGTLEHVEKVALETWKSTRWQEFDPSAVTIVKITRGPLQIFIKSYILKRSPENA